MRSGARGVRDGEIGGGHGERQNTEARRHGDVLTVRGLQACGPAGLRPARRTRPRNTGAPFRLGGRLYFRFLTSFVPRAARRHRPVFSVSPCLRVWHFPVHSAHLLSSISVNSAPPQNPALSQPRCSRSLLTSGSVGPSTVTASEPFENSSEATRCTSATDTRWTPASVSSRPKCLSK